MLRTEAIALQQNRWEKCHSTWSVVVDCHALNSSITTWLVAVVSQPSLLSSLKLSPQQTPLQLRSSKQRLHDVANVNPAAQLMQTGCAATVKSDSRMWWWLGCGVDSWLWFVTWSHRLYISNAGPVFLSSPQRPCPFFFQQYVLMARHIISHRWSKCNVSCSYRRGCRTIASMCRKLTFRLISFRNM